jgi:hypothetical protein
VSTAPDPESLLAQWVRNRRGPLLAHVDGARAAVASAAKLPSVPGEPVAVCTDRWLNALPAYAPEAPASYAVSGDGDRRLVHVTAPTGEWTYVVDPDHVVDPGFLPRTDLCGWTLRRLDDPATQLPEVDRQPSRR